MEKPEPSVMGESESSAIERFLERLFPTIFEIPRCAKNVNHLIKGGEVLEILKESRETMKSVREAKQEIPYHVFTAGIGIALCCTCWMAASWYTLRKVETLLQKYAKKTEKKTLKVEE